MEAAQSIPTRNNVAFSLVNYHQLLLSNWNILTITGKELELDRKQNGIISKLLEFLQPKKGGSGTVDLDGGWKLFYSGADSI